jgi:hypothetical protein
MNVGPLIWRTSVQDFGGNTKVQRGKSMSQIVVDLGTKNQELSDGVDELTQVPEKTEREASI